MLKLEKLTAGYDGCPVISDINASFEKGSITTIIGANGSGKSTLLKAAMGLCTLMDGEFFLDGKNQKTMDTKEFARKVSYLPQSHTASSISAGRMVLHGRFPYLSYPRHYSKKDYELCNLAMERLGILSLKEKRMEELSGGERQKVYLAMALAGETEVFLLDEPTTYLDIHYQLELLYLMQELRTQGKTVVMVLHDLNYAMQISDKIIVMQKGKVLAEGTPKQIASGGVIEKAFGVHSKRLYDEAGEVHYIFNL